MVPDNASDEDLLARFLAGDESAFTSLMHRYEDPVFKIALRMTSNRADALDATQDAFVALFRRAHSFRGDAAFSTWMYRIAVNSCHDLMRKRGRALPTEHVDDAAQTRSPEDATAAQIDVARALARLPEEYRVAVVLHDLAGATHDEIAATLGVAVGTVKSRISRGRRALAAILEPERAEPASNPEGTTR
ncbi:MAG: RNA polymerase sigma factor [Actinomycetota bacterium]